MKIILISLLIIFLYSYTKVTVNHPKKVGIDDVFSISINTSNNEKIIINSHDFKLLLKTGTSVIKTIINGKITQKKTTSYQFKPKKKGLSIFYVTINGEKNSYKIEVVNEQIIDPNKNQSANNYSLNFFQNQRFNNSNIDKNSIIIENHLSKKKLFINEIGYIETILYNKFPVRIANLSMVKDFSKQCYNLIKVENFDKKSQKVTYRQQPYQKRIIMKHLIYPLHSGKCEIKDLVIRVELVGSIFSFKNNVTIPVKAISLKALKYPLEKKLPNFNNQYGDFKIKTQLSKLKPEKNEPIILTVIIYGKGNFESLIEPYFKEPNPTTNHIEIKKGKIFDRFKISQDNLIGEKVYKYFLIGQRVGKTPLPTVLLDFYSSKKKKIISLEHALPEIEVQKNLLQNSSTLNSSFNKNSKNIIYIETKLSPKTSSPWLYYLFGGLALLTSFTIKNRKLIQKISKSTRRLLIKDLDKSINLNNQNDDSLENWSMLKNKLLHFLVNYFNLEITIAENKLLNIIQQKIIDLPEDNQNKINKKDLLKFLIEKTIIYQKQIYSSKESDKKLNLSDEVNSLKKILTKI